MDKSRYEECLKSAAISFEDICSRCGECCGSLDDPCYNLKKADGEKYLCVGYEGRLGYQKTESGYKFKCVSIREHIANRTLRENCSYRNHVVNS